jgi:hypothetical protein
MKVFDLDMIQRVYERYPARIAAARKVVGRPLTLSEKIDELTESIEKKQSNK